MRPELAIHGSQSPSSGEGTLYDRSKISEVSKRNKLRDLKEQMMSEYTFIPRTNITRTTSTKTTPASGDTVFERLYQRRRTKNATHGNKGASSGIARLTSCASSVGSSATESVFDRLYRSGRKIRKTDKRRDPLGTLRGRNERQIQASSSCLKSEASGNNVQTRYPKTSGDVSGDQGSNPCPDSPTFSDPNNSSNVSIYDRLYQTSTAASDTKKRNTSRNFRPDSSWIHKENEEKQTQSHRDRPADAVALNYIDCNTTASIVPFRSLRTTSNHRIDMLYESGVKKIRASKTAQAKQGQRESRTITSSHVRECTFMPNAKKKRRRRRSKLVMEPHRPLRRLVGIPKEILVPQECVLVTAPSVNSCTATTVSSVDSPQSPPQIERLQVQDMPTDNRTSLPLTDAVETDYGSI